MNGTVAKATSHTGVRCRSRWYIQVTLDNMPAAHLHYLRDVLLRLLRLGVSQQHTAQGLHSRSCLRQVLLQGHSNNQPLQHTGVRGMLAE